MIICNQCWPHTRFIGWVLPGLALVQLDGSYGLMIEPAHRDELIVQLSAPPERDPWHGMSDEEVDALPIDDPINERAVEWATCMDQDLRPLGLKLGVMGSYELVRDALLFGYVREEGSFEAWLYDRIGKTYEESLHD